MINPTLHLLSNIKSRSIRSDRVRTKVPESTVAIVAEPNYISNAPNDVIRHIFMYLIPSNLRNARLVCKRWYQIASVNTSDKKLDITDIPSYWHRFHLTELFPKATVIDSKVWRSHFDIEGHQLIFDEEVRPYVRNKDEYIELRRMAFRVEKGLGITILTLPEGLTINLVIAIAAALKQRKLFLFRHIWNRLIQEFGNVRIEKTVTIAITNGIFKGSRKTTFPKRIAIINDLKCNIPPVLAVMALAMMRFISSPPKARLRLFGNHPWTWILCNEVIDDKRIAFGGSTNKGSGVGGDNNINNHELGVGGLREFAVIE